MYLLFDIGGTKTRIAYSEDGITFGAPVICETHQNFEEAIAEYKKIVNEVVGNKNITAAAAGVRALDISKERLKLQPNFPLWEDQPLKQALEDALSIPVYLENDAALAGLGEAVDGAGKGFDIVVYMTVSTGVGGARIVNRKIDANAMGFEPGNQVIGLDAPEFLENLISGTAFEKRYGKKPYEVTDIAVWNEAARILAYGLNNTIVHWSPNVVVLGGSMITGNPAISLDVARRELQSIMKIFPVLPELKKAELGDIGGLHGALAFLKLKV